MKNSKRYLGMVFSEHIEKLIPVIEKHVNIEIPNYQMFSVSNSTLSFVSFFSTSNLADIKSSIKEKDKKVDFMIFDISNQGDTFDMRCKGLEDYILLTGLNNIIEPEPAIPEEPKIMDLDSLLELVNKNGWKTLTKEQKTQLQKYSEE